MITDALIHGELIHTALSGRNPGRCELNGSEHAGGFPMIVCSSICQFVALSYTLGITDAILSGGCETGPYAVRLDIIEI